MNFLKVKDTFSHIKSKQYLRSALAVTVGLGVLGIILLSIHEPEPVHTDAPQETHITTAGNRLGSQELWVERLEGENKLTSAKLDALEKLMIANVKNAGETEEKIERLTSDLEDLKPLLSPDPLPVAPHPSSSESELLTESGIRKITLNLSNARSVLTNQQKATLENTLPAGTFAKAILLGGVDASTAVAAPSDPRPVLLRVTDSGTLPRKFKSDLKGCHVLASAYGDLSSERVYMRLEKLTCVEPLTGEISETVVSGYVAGGDGKAGVRGIVVDKAGAQVRNSLLGGFFSGMGKFFESQNAFALPLTPFTAGSGLNSKEMLLSSSSRGASTALDKYAEFFIKRAEQLQPVLQASAGLEVDIIFTQGTRFGDTSVRQSLSKIRNRSRQEAIQKLETQSDTQQNWLPKVPSEES